MTLLESREMYLETILILSQKSDRVRSIDIREASFQEIKKHLAEHMKAIG